MERFDGWDTELYHHGIKGQKWGIRRFQNEDGSLTPAGEKHYGINDKASYLNSKITQHRLNRLDSKIAQKKVDIEDQAKKLDAIEYLYGEKRSKFQQNRYSNAKSYMEKSKKKLEKYRSLSQQILKNAESKGYSVTSKNVMRYAISGKDRAHNFDMSVYTSSYSRPRSYTEVKGTKYRVSKNR